jgi:hypothetical protein
MVSKSDSCFSGNRECLAEKNDEKPELKELICETYSKFKFHV